MKVLFAPAGGLFISRHITINGLNKRPLIASHNGPDSGHPPASSLSVQKHIRSTSEAFEPQFRGV